jgi:hypothetical protein
MFFRPRATTNKAAAPARNRSERSEPSDRANRAPTIGGTMSGHVLPSRKVTTTSDSRFSRRHSAGGDGRTTPFRSARSDEDGGNPANIAASEASNRTQRAMREQQRQ